jgi:hypothetical protein
MSEKVCRGCKVSKSVGLFTGNQTVCLECKKNPNIILTKICTTCSIENVEKTHFPGGRAVCKDCVNKSKRVSNNKQLCVACKKEKIKADFRRNQPACKECEEQNIPYSKECIECREIKPDNMFRLNRKKCLDCERAYGRNYGKVTDTRKVWVENNREKMSELQHKAYEKNKEEIRLKEKTRYAEDGHVRKIKAYRASVCSFIKGRTKTCVKLCISSIAYKVWLNFCFSEDMSMENYGKIWSIDHIIPLNCLKTKKLGDCDLGDDIDYIYLWYNTVPVLCKDNLTKNKHLANPKVLAQHLLNVNSFLKQNKQLEIKLDDNFLTYKKTVQRIIDNM